MPHEVPPAVRIAFGLSDHEPRPLAGGMVTPLVVDGVVVKPTDDPTLARWCQLVVASIEPVGFAVPRPIAARDGRWAVDGWIATEYVDGLRPLIDEPVMVAATGRRFADALNRPSTSVATKDLGRSPVATRTDRWARAYRYAWDAEPCPIASEAEAIAESLRSVWSTQPSQHTRRVFHCDLTGNVLADVDGRCFVVDFTPAIGPIDFGTAVVVADHLLWHDGRANLIHDMGVDHRLVARALAFRLVAEQLALPTGRPPRHGARLDDHRRVLRLLNWDRS